MVIFEASLQAYIPNSSYHQSSTLSFKECVKDIVGLFVRDVIA